MMLKLSALGTYLTLLRGTRARATACRWEAGSGSNAVWLDAHLSPYAVIRLPRRVRVSWVPPRVNSRCFEVMK